MTASQVGSGQKFAYTFDRDDLLTSAGDLKITRDPGTGLVTRLSLGVLNEQFTHNGFGELVSQTAEANGVTFFSAQLSRDKLGRVTEITESIRGVTAVIAYSYDAGSRLQSVRRNGVSTESYTYDNHGNLLGDHMNGAYSYNDADQLLSAGDASFTYIPTGERFTRTKAGATDTYRYTALSRLRAVDLADGRALRYLHDPAGNRAVRLIDGTVQQRYLCPSYNLPAGAVNPSGQLIDQYVYALSESAPEYITLYRGAWLSGSSPIISGVSGSWLIPRTGRLSRN
ncbi:MAG: hypothetical protein L0Z50_14670 [Verrucomicrobiales bacterium]|nr:hypothetical protein [Verrucomicrobiales bacterium]